MSLYISGSPTGRRSIQKRCLTPFPTTYDSAFMELLALLEKIPATFWGVVIGSFFSLGGVVLANRASDRRLQAQLDHDRQLKTRERDLSLRKDVYLAAAEAVTAGFNAVARLADLNIPYEKLTEQYQNKASSIAKVSVIAKEETVKAFERFTNELGGTFLRLSVKRYPLTAQQQKIAILRDQLKHFESERDRMVELMEQHNLDGPVDQRRWDQIQKKFDFEQDRIKKTLEEITTLGKELYSRQLEYTRECVSESMNLRKLLVPALIAVRRELELPIDEASYLRIVEESAVRQEANLREFLENVRGMVDNQFSQASNTLDK